MVQKRVRSDEEKLERSSRPEKRQRQPKDTSATSTNGSAATISTNKLVLSQATGEDGSSALQSKSMSPKPISRTPSPVAQSPPRQRKRPGGASRISNADKDAARQIQIQRERYLLNQSKAEVAARGVHDVVRQHYNAVPERGKAWRMTDSKIKGLRSFNNWVKSALIQKFSPNEDYTPGMSAKKTGPEPDGRSEDSHGLLVLDIGCGKGGDLQKWQQAPQRVELYVGLDPAEVSIEQARERYSQMGRRGRGGQRWNQHHLFRGEFVVKDCFGEWLGDVPIVRQVGIDPSVGPEGPQTSQRWGGGGFDVVSMMFCMHYAFESETKARGMLRNVAGSLRKGGRFLGVIPNSDKISAKVEEFHRRHHQLQHSASNDDDWDPEKSLDMPEEHAVNGRQGRQLGGEEVLEWGNSIYRVKFPGKTPEDGVFRPPFGWKYFYFLEEAVSEVPEYVVPWEAFRGLAEDYNLELQYRKPFNEIWDNEKDDQVLGPLSERMGVRGRDKGSLLVSPEELGAASFYHAFCFYKV